MTTTRPSANAGWYPDPSNPGRIRYWDGTTWTQHSLVAPPAVSTAWAAPAPTTNLTTGLTTQRTWWQTWWAIVPGLVLCFPVGLVGLWLRRGTSNPVKWIVTAAVAMLLVVGVVTSPDSTSDADSATPRAPLASPSHVTTVDPAPQTTPEPQVQLARVPVLTGLTLAEARDELRSDHLKGGAIQRRPAAAPPGTVLSQGFRKGQQVAWHSAIPLVIAIPLPHIPAVSGRSASAAAAALRDAGFRVRTIHKTVTSGTEGAVLSQSPEAGQPVRPGALVTIVVAHVVRPLTSTPTQSAGCTPGYTPCLPPASDYDCAGGSGDGPKYTGLVHVTGSDPYDLDADGDGLGCTS